MGTLYLGPYLWPLSSPLGLFRRGEGSLVVFISQADAAPEAQELLGKVCASVGFAAESVGIWLVQAPLSVSRLQLFSEPLLWVFGALLPGAAIGAYTLEPFAPLREPPARRPQQRMLFVLPALAQMIAQPESKKQAWQWIRGLGSNS